jgi:phospholipase C
MVISPFSRGGLVASDVFDHTSQLRLLERRFNVPVTTLTQWRRGTVGDLTSAFNFSAVPQDNPPKLPGPDAGVLSAVIEGNLGILLGFRQDAPPYPIPANSMPIQPSLPLRGRPSGLGLPVN